MELSKIIIRRISLISTCMSVMHANPHTICNSITHTHTCANIDSTSSHPWIRKLRAAESTCACVPVFVMIVMPLHLCPVACYLRVCPAFKDGGLRGEPCLHYTLVWANDWLQPATMAVTPPPLPSPPQSRPLILLHAPPLWSTGPSHTTIELPPNTP